MENTINEIKEMITKIQELQDLKENLSIDDLDVNQEELFNEMLDDCYETVTICNIEFFPSDVLKSCDPIAYRCGLNDYFGDVDIKNFSEYHDKVNEINEQIDEIKQEIHDIIEDL